MAEPEIQTVTLNVDGHEVTVPKGTNVIEAARKVGIDISAFCYHPGLSIAACCRQCLVTIEGSPKLQPSCQARCTDGMVVHTDDKNAVAARRQMLELTLVNHPIDCPICDKAGECTLQKLYFDHDNINSRVDVPKVHKPKVVDLGPHVILDAERCILCTRCIRVCDEVAGEHQLEMRNRGDHEEICTAPGALLDNPYSINTVDVCPVGALTSKDYRFTMRAWELMMTPSVCQGCATGCNTEIHHKSGRVWRLVPRENPEVNGHWMCDEGRFTYKDLSEDRLASPVKDGLPASWERAVEAAAKRLMPILEQSRDRVGVVLSPHFSNEDNYALAKLARDMWQIERIYIGGKMPVPERADDILRDADVSPNRRGVKAIAGEGAAGVSVLAADLASDELSALVILGHDVPLSEDALAALTGLEAVIVISDRDVGIAGRAHVALPAAAWAEVSGTMTNRQGITQRIHPALTPPGLAVPAWDAIRRLAIASNAAMTYDGAKQVFSEMTQAVPELSTDWGRDARPIQLRFAGSRG